MSWLASRPWNGQHSSSLGAPGELIGSAVDSMVAELFTEVCGPFGFPIDDDAQITAPWACPGCASIAGSGVVALRSGAASSTSLVGVVSLRSAMVECRSCRRRFSPLGQLLGLAPRQRRTPELSKATAALAVEVAYVKAARLMAEVGGVEVSARTIRRDLIAAAPHRLGPLAVHRCAGVAARRHRRTSRPRQGRCRVAPGHRHRHPDAARQAAPRVGSNCSPPRSTNDGRSCSTSSKGSGPA